MNKKLIYLMLSSALLMQNVTAQNTEGTISFNLKESIAFALENGTSTRKAMLNEQESEYNIKQVRSDALPQLNAFGSFDDNLNIPVQLLPGELVGQPAGTTIEAQFGQQYTVTGGFELNQKLFDQSVFTGLQAAKEGREFYSLQTRKAKEAIIYMVASDYYNVLITREQLNILRANLEKTTALIEVSESQYEAGIIKKIDVSRLKVAKTNTETDIQNLKSQLTAQLNKLKYDMGMPISQPVILSDSLGLMETDVNEVMLEEDLIKRRTDYRLIEKQKQLNLLEIKNFKAGYYPTLSAYGRYSYNAQRDEFNFFDGSEPWFKTFVIGASLNIPIFDGFRKRAQVQQSQVRLDKLSIDQNDTQRAINMEYQNALNQLQNSLQSKNAQQANVELAQEVYNVTEETYKEGISPLSDLLNAETELLTAQTNYTESLLQYKLANLQLQKATGALLTLVDEN